jgi:hypothetical protein
MHIVESAGVPHTEVGELGTAASLIEVFPHKIPIRLDEPRFVLDGHLGRLAAYLRMLGFDTSYSRDAHDPELASIAGNENRVLLTRDVGLLKRREVLRGYCVRNAKPRDQLHEVVRRFGLGDRIAPFTRCMECNERLAEIPKQEIADLVPPYVYATKDIFSRCVQCGKIYWRGTHHAVMTDLIDRLRS